MKPHINSIVREEQLHAIADVIRDEMRIYVNDQVMQLKEKHKKLIDTKLDKN